MFWTEDKEINNLIVEGSTNLNDEVIEINYDKQTLTDKAGLKFWLDSSNYKELIYSVTNSRYEFDDDIYTSGSILGSYTGTASGLSSTGDINCYLDTDNNESSKFRVFNGSGTEIFSIDETGACIVRNTDPNGSLHTFGGANFGSPTQTGNLNLYGYIYSPVDNFEIHSDNNLILHLDNLNSHSSIFSVKNGSDVNILELTEEGNLTITGNINPNGYEITPTAIDNTDSPYTMLASDSMIVCDTSGGDVTLNLIASASYQHRLLSIKKEGGPNTLTIQVDGADTICSTESKISLIDYHTATLFCNGTNWNVVISETMNIENKNVGFVDLGTNSTIVFDYPVAGQVRITLTFTAETTLFGRKQRIVPNATVLTNTSTPSTDGIQYYYIDEDTLTLERSTTFPGFSGSTIYVAFAYWDHTNQIMLNQAKETHGTQMSQSTHSYLHNTIGTRYMNGFVLTGNIVSGNPSGDDESRVYISGGTIRDEDLEHTVVHTTTPTNPFEQDLGTAHGSTTAGIFYVYYKTGNPGVWRRVLPPNRLVYDITGVTKYPNYNQNSGGTWSLTEMTDNDYISMWLVATNSMDNPIILVMGQAIYTSYDDLQQGDTPDTINIADLIPEGKILYRIAIRSRDKYNNATYEAKVHAITDYRNSDVNVVNSSYTIGDHSGLSNLSYNLSGHTDFQRATHSYASAPTVNDDEDNTSGTMTGPAEVGDFWLNTSTNDLYICTDNTATASVWNQLIINGDLELSGDLRILGTKKIHSTESLLFQIDSDNNGTTNAFQFKNGNFNNIMLLSENGDLSTTGDLEVSGTIKSLGDIDFQVDYGNGTSSNYNFKNGSGSTVVTFGETANQTNSGANSGSSTILNLENTSTSASSGVQINMNQAQVGADNYSIRAIYNGSFNQFNISCISEPKVFQCLTDSNQTFMPRISSGSQNDLHYNTTTGELVYVSSTREDKKNVADYDIDSKKLLNSLQLKRYQRKNDPNNLWEIGLIAEDLGDSLYENDMDVSMFITKNKENKVTGYRSSLLKFILIDRVKEQATEIETLSNENVVLKNEITSLNTRLQKLERNYLVLINNLSEKGIIELK